MSRKSHEELQEIKNKHNVDKLWSWSKLNTYKTSPFEFFLNYVVKPKVKKDRDNSAYAPYGTCSHEILERFYNNDISYEDMIGEFEDGVFTLELADLKFDRSDEPKNASIKEKYIYNLKHFFRHHNPIIYKVALEQFVIAKIGRNIFQCYLDCVFKDDDGYYNITDFKTSSMYKGNKLSKEKGQLILYAIGLNQMGVPLDKIKVCWNFLKYCKVQVEQANGKIIDRCIERANIGKDLKSNCKMWLKKLGYTDELDNYIELLMETNSTACLPQEVQEKYSFDDCYVYVPLDKNVVNKQKIEVIDTIAEIEKKESEYHQTLNEKLFYDDEASVKEQSFYFSNLCEYSPKLHKPYGLYLEKFNANKNDNMFGGIGEDIGCEKDDMAWLDAI